MTVNTSKKEHNRWFYNTVKRIFDIVASFIGLVVLMPFMLVIALIIWLDDKGSPLYVQTRVGKKGKEFKFLKFRSMVVGADQLQEKLQSQNEKDGPVFKIKDDPRITRVGRFLRKTSLDELPQLWNVFTGSMSVVGPRPALPSEIEQYTPRQRMRLAVTPGLTCYWQTKKDRDSVPFDEWVEMDIQYINDCSFWTDIKLIFKTFLVVFGAQGH